MTRLFLDYETRSPLDLNEVGLDNYVNNPLTEVVLGGYACDDDAVSLWEPHKSNIPRGLLDGFSDPNVLIYSWNCSFERMVTKWILEIDIPIKRFRDPMIQARYVSLPGNLDECGKALRLPVMSRKHEDGQRLINLFCLPVKPGGQETLFGLSEPIFRDAESDPKDWALFCSYCKQDVEAERAISKKLDSFPIPEDELRLFEIDQEINERGVCVNSQLVDGGAYIAETEKTTLIEKLHTLTGLENPNSTDQLLDWLSKQGYAFHSIGKPFVARALAGECNLTSSGKEVLTTRQQAAKTSATKLISIRNQISSDNRLRHQYNFYGARTGRWTSGAGD